MNNKGNDENELINEITKQISNNNRELIKLSAIINENKKQLKYKNILMTIELIIIFILVALLLFLPTINNNRKDNKSNCLKGDSGIMVTNNEFDNDSTININQKEDK